MKRMSSGELRTAISGMKHTEVIYEDDLWVLDSTKSSEDHE